jgi:hypothetical protein
MKIYGGRNMVDRFVLNYAGPTLKNVKRENNRGLQFISSEHWEIYGIVAKIYRYTKIAHVITWTIMIILPKDEMEAKGRFTLRGRANSLCKRLEILTRDWPKGSNWSQPLYT